MTAQCWRTLRAPVPETQLVAQFCKRLDRRHESTQRLLRSLTALRRVRYCLSVQAQRARDQLVEVEHLGSRSVVDPVVIEDQLADGLDHLLRGGNRFGGGSRPAAP